MFDVVKEYELSYPDVIYILSIGILLFLSRPRDWKSKQTCLRATLRQAGKPPLKKKLLKMNSVSLKSIKLVLLRRTLNNIDFLTLHFIHSYIFRYNVSYFKLNKVLKLILYFYTRGTHMMNVFITNCIYYAMLVSFF